MVGRHVWPALALALLIFSGCAADRNPWQTPEMTGPAEPSTPVATVVQSTATAPPVPSPASTAAPLPATLVPTRSPVPTAAPRPTIAPTPAPPASPETISPELAALQAALSRRLASWGGQHAVSIRDLQSGETIGVNADRPQLAACTIKFVIMMAVAEDIEAGRYSETEVAPLVRSAMGPSNNPPARELLRYAGGGDIGAGIARVNDIMWRLGATHSILTHPPGYPEEEYGYKASRGVDENLIAAADMTLLQSKLYRGEALSPWATGYVLKSLTIAPDWMDASLGAALGDDARLYHKIGQLYAPENTWNDAGLIVVRRDGRDYAYAITYLGSYGGSWQEAYDHAQAVSSLAWSWFTQRYGTS